MVGVAHDTRPTVLLCGSNVGAVCMLLCGNNAGAVCMCYGTKGNTIVSVVTCIPLGDTVGCTAGVAVADRCVASKLGMLRWWG